MKKACILLADDHPSFRESIADILQRTGKYDIIEAADGQEVLRLVERHPGVDCILLDYHMPGFTGLEIAEKLALLLPHVPVVLMSSYGGKPQGWVQEKADLANVTYADKNAEDILRALEKSVYVGQDIYIDDATRAHLQDMGFVFGSEAMNTVIQRALNAAKSDLNVLITGETGVGKTQLARVVHALSPRSGSQFISFACSNYAANQQLFTSQVFGHTRSAFTSATVDRPSLFEEAGSGTLFLDEISEIPIEAQTTLLTALDERRYRRLGEHTVRPINCRIITATNRNLDEASDGRIFRKDLMLRLKQEYIEIPPLNARIDDIPELVRLYLREFARQDNGRRLRIEPEAVAYLKRQQWPGNTRQLRSIINRVAHNTSGGSITVADLYTVMKDESSRSAAPQVHTRVAAPVPAEPVAVPLPMSVEEIIDRSVRGIFDGELSFDLKQVVEMFRRRLIEESLRRTAGNVKEAERQYWGYAATGKGGLMHQIKKFELDPRQYRR